MTEVGAADRATFLHSKRAKYVSIVTSRKRKLHELFAVATCTDGLPNHRPNVSDATPLSSAEVQFFLRCDILQGLRLDELSIPKRRPPHADTVNRFLASCPPHPDHAEPVAQGSSSASTSLKAQRAPKHIAAVTPAFTPSNLLLCPESKELEDRNALSPVPSGVAGAVPATVECPDLRGPAPRNGLSNPLLAEHATPTYAVDAAISASPVQAAPGTANGAAGDPPIVAEPAQDEVGAVESLVDAASCAGEFQSGKGVSWDAPGAHGSDEEPGNIHNTPRLARRPQHDLSVRHPPQDMSQITDASSSPGSTTHTVATPAVHDASTDTSPDNEGPRFSKKQRERSQGAVAGIHSDGEVEQRPSVSQCRGEAVPLTAAREDRASSSAGAEEQLLREGAASGSGVLAYESCLEGAGNVKTDGEPGQHAGQQAAHDAVSCSSPGYTCQDLGVGHSTNDFQKASHPLHTKKVGGEDVAAHTGSVESQNPKQKPSVSAPEGVSRRPSSHHEVVNDAAIDRLTGKLSHVERIEASKGDRTISATGPVPLTSTVRDQSSYPSPPPPSGPLADARFLPERYDRPMPRKVPVVTFGDKVNLNYGNPIVSSIRQEAAAAHLSSEDYFTTLFVQGFTQSAKWMKTIDATLNQAHKTLTTSDSHLSILENQACRVLRRVYHLQQMDKWSLRQPKRCPEPTRSPAHWDMMLQEMRWMRTDFREERKWKRAAARNLAKACAAWTFADADQRRAMQVRARTPVPRLRPDSPISTRATDDSRMLADSADVMDEVETPDIVPSCDQDPHVDAPEGPRKPGEPAEAGAGTRTAAQFPAGMAAAEAITKIAVPATAAPASIFVLPDDEVVFGISRSAASDRLLSELPLYGAPLKAPRFDITLPDCDDTDRSWRRPALPLSKYVDQSLVLATSEPPAKRSRYRYRAEESSDEEVEDGMAYKTNHDVTATAPGFGVGALPDRENTTVALFSPEMQATRERLHAGHQFRPPTEYSMPQQSFYESRSASQWTWAEDDELKALVREYSYNWSLISSMLSTKSVFSSGPERRTPWECFERWVQLEGLPNDMSKTQYFRTYQHRIDAAQQVISQRNQSAAAAAAAAQAQAGPNAAVTPLPRKRSTTTMRVERRRNQKHLALIDAMRKLAKKRESVAQKQQQAASVSAMRKVNEAQQQSQSQSQQQTHHHQQQQQQAPRGPNKTPRDYSLMRWERDQQLTERMAQYAQKQQQEAQRKRPSLQALATRSQGQAAAAAAAAAASQTGAAVSATSMAGAAASLPPQIAAQMAQMVASASAAGVASGSGPGPGAVRASLVANVPAQVVIAGQQRARLAAQAAQNPMAGLHQQQHAPGAPISINGMSQAPMQGPHRVAIPASAPADMGLMFQAQLIQSQQRSVQIQQQQHHHHQHQHHPHPSQSPGQTHAHQQQQSMGPPAMQPRQPQPQPQAQQSPQQQAGVMQGSSSTTGMRNALNGVNNQQNYLANVQAMAAFNAAQQNGGAMSPPLNGMAAAGSPRAAVNGHQHVHASAQHLQHPLSHGGPPHPHPHQQAHPHPHQHPSAHQLQHQQHQHLQQASSAALAHFEAQIRSKNPSMPIDQVRKLAQASLDQRLHQQRMNAINAAAGSSPKPGLVAPGLTGTPQQLAQLLRAREAQHAKAQQAAAAAAAAMPTTPSQNGSGLTQQQQQHQRQTSSNNSA